MKKKRLWTLIGGLCLVFILGTLPLKGICAEWPEDLIAISPAPGASVHMVLVGMGKVIENRTPIKHWIVQPLGGAKTWAPMLKKNKAHIAKLETYELELLHPTLGEHIVKEYGLRFKTGELIKDCRFMAKDKHLNAYDAAVLIIKELWQKLRKTHALRVVK